MPIHCDILPSSLPVEVFKEVDYRVTGHAFRIHNDLGNLLNEDVYQAELQARLHDAGLSAIMEMGVTLSYGSFRRRYACDLIVEKGILYETKAVKRLLGKHQEQVLHYLFLTGLRNGKLLNFRPDSLEHRFVTTHWTEQERRDIRIETSGWQKAPFTKEIQALASDLLQDWGAGLMGTVYRDALISLSPDVTIRETCLRTPHGITRNSMMPMFPDGSFLHFSTLRKNQQRYEKNLRKWFLSFQPPAIHWINLNGPTLQYRSLTP